MKVLLLNGSTRKDGCTYLALSEAAKALNEQGVETDRPDGRRPCPGLHRLQRLCREGPVCLWR